MHSHVERAQWLIVSVSPYMTLTSMVSSLTMICVLEYFVEDLSEDTTNSTTMKVVTLLLDAFNNVLSFGYNTNSYLVFCMILSHKMFHKLDSMSRTSLSKFTDPGSLSSSLDQACHVFPTKNVVRFLDILVPQVEKLCEESAEYDEESIAAYLRRSTVVGVINRPTQILTRRFEIMDSVYKWIHLYTWTIIYTRYNDLRLYLGSNVTLFNCSKSSDQFE